ncbi:hypothetical protein [Nocardia sp. BMG111209]|uniref:hypothetical protein n=1 Tax=Nocardia sp. BMG111209 TaxID=1160137 RepID=UPI000371EB0B|nr:hypothetical protein [Nocardia sp. BMG111209]
MTGHDDQPAPPVTPWPALKGIATGGFNMKFDDSVASDLIGTISDLIAGVKALKQEVGRVTGDGPLSSLVSGQELAKQFSAKGKELGQICDDHLAILSDMIDTVQAAAKTYAQAEGHNQAVFDSINKDPAPARLVDIPGPTSIPNVGEHDEPKDLQNAQGFEDVTIQPETPASLSLEKLNALMSFYGWGTTNIPERVRDFSDTWNGMAAQLAGIFAEFASRANRVTDQSWTGPGGAIAARSIRTYAKSSAHLQDNMTAFGKTLLYTAGWIEATTNALDNVDSTKMRTSYLVFHDRVYAGDVEYRNRLADAYGKTYVPGMQFTCAHIPVLEHPAAAFNGIPSDQGVILDPGAPVPPAPVVPVGPGPGTAVSPTSPISTALGPGDAPAVPSDIPAPQDDLQAKPPATEPADPSSTRSPLDQLGQQAASLAQQLGSTAQQAGQQAAGTAEQLAQQAAQFAQQAAQGVRGDVTDAASKLAPIGLESAGPGLAGPGLGGGAGSGAGGGTAGIGGPNSSSSRNPSQSARLFPRAATPAAATNAAAESSTTAGRAGIAAGAGSPGMPAGAAHGAGGQQSKERKRAAYLDSTEHLDDALGKGPQVVKPVVEK